MPTNNIFQVLAAIPEGKVLTYGAVAKMAGLGRAARHVGTTLSKLPEDTTLPWHRVLGANGKITLPHNHPSHTEQCARLRAEGIAVNAGKIRLRDYLWQP